MIPVSAPQLGTRELEFITECVQSGWVSSAGRFIDEFERQWAAYCGRSFGIAVSNGTVALQAAMSALDLDPGDEVILPTFTIISCAQAVTYAGAMPVLVDADPVTWGIDPDQVAAKITTRTRAIMPVHIYGHPVDMDPLLDLANRHNLAIIEDAAEVHGAEYLMARASDNPLWRRCGSFGTMSTFSFYANKLITTGEGGMVLTDDPAIAAKLRSLRNLCFQSARRFYHEDLGFNFRMTNLQAALGLAQLERIDDIVARKRWIGQEYNRRLVDLPGIQLPTEQAWARNVYWVYGIVLDESTGMDAAVLATRLSERGVDTRPFFLGMHEQPVFQRMGLFQNEHCPVAERLARQGLYLPSGLPVTEVQIGQVCAALRAALEQT
jgi:perosamine synthetase